MRSSKRQWRARAVRVCDLFAMFCDPTDLRPANWSYMNALKCAPPVPTRQRFIDCAKTISDAARALIANNLEKLLGV
jgi:hypothetical protein